MTFSTDDSCVVENKYSEDEIAAITTESREARKHLRKLGRVMKTVVAHRLKERTHLRTVDKLATWRRTRGFDRLADGDDNWVHGLLPPTPEQITTSLWADLKELKDAISLSGKDGLRQKVRDFINTLGREMVSFTDEEFAMIKRFVERRGRDAAHVTVAPVGTVHYCSPRSSSPEILFGTRVHMEKKDEDMEENNEGRMDPEQDQLESPSASTGFETPEPQCNPNWETGRTTASGCLTAGVDSIFGGNIFSCPKIARRADGEITTPCAASNTFFLQTRRKPKDQRTCSEENKQFDPGGKGVEPPPW